MTDPWDVAANTLSARQAAMKRIEQARRDEAAARLAARRQAAAEADRAMRAAIEFAVPQLEALMAQRGTAAQRLLAASGEGAYILFGSARGGGKYCSVYLDQNGLRREVGTCGGLGSKPTDKRAATAREAIEAFAYRGAGKDKPELVRIIVTWLTDQVDAYAPR